MAFRSDRHLATLISATAQSLEAFSLTSSRCDVFQRHFINCVKLDRRILAASLRETRLVLGGIATLQHEALALLWEGALRQSSSRGLFWRIRLSEVFHLKPFFVIVFTRSTGTRFGQPSRADLVSQGGAVVAGRPRTVVRGCIGELSLAGAAGVGKL